MSVCEAAGCIRVIKSRTIKLLVSKQHLKRYSLFKQRVDHFQTIIPCTHAIKPNAMGYIILIVPSYDPNLDKVALSQFSAWVRFVDLCVNVQSKHYPEIMIKDD